MQIGREINNSDPDGKVIIRLTQSSHAGAGSELGKIGEGKRNDKNPSFGLRWENIFLPQLFWLTKGINTINILLFWLLFIQLLYFIALILHWVSALVLYTVGRGKVLFWCIILDFDPKLCLNKIYTNGQKWCLWILFIVCEGEYKWDKKKILFWLYSKFLSFLTRSSFRPAPMINKKVKEILKTHVQQVITNLVNEFSSDIYTRCWIIYVNLTKVEYTIWMKIKKNK